MPVAFLTLLDGADPGTVRQEVNHDVISQLGGYARLGAVYLTGALPKTRTGKTMRRLLRDVVSTAARGATPARWRTWPACRPCSRRSPRKPPGA